MFQGRILNSSASQQPDLFYKGELRPIFGIVESGANFLFSVSKGIMVISYSCGSALRRHRKGNRSPLSFLSQIMFQGRIQLISRTLECLAGVERLCISFSPFAKFANFAIFQNFVNFRLLQNLLLLQILRSLTISRILRIFAFCLRRWCAGGIGPVGHLAVANLWRGLLPRGVSRWPDLGAWSLGLSL